MSRVGNLGCWCAAVAAFTLPAYGQYPGHVDTAQQQGGTHLRATAVLEYTGDLPDPKATRLIPIAIWDGTQYQPGGLYLAQPAPLAVQSGTQYILETDGRPKGFFNIQEAEDLGGHWIGIGKYLAPPTPKARPRPSAHMPQVVKEYDPDKPHFAHVPTDENSNGQEGTGSQTAPAADPNRPTLHERPNSGGGGNSGSTASQPPVDPDRPTFHHEADSQPSTANSGTTAAASARSRVDPDRPLLSYSAPVEQEKIDKADALVGVPEEMKQMAGISDTRTPSGDSYQYSWSNPDDAVKMKAALETIAEQALTPAAATAKPAAEKEKSGSARRRHKVSRPEAPKLPVLADEQFKVFGLTFGGGATMVLTARSTGDSPRYVTVIAQPDFYGQPQVLLKQVTSEAELDVIPRMHLVDAVDTEGNGRADLIFELRGRTYRQFAIYRVAGGTATQVFVTQPTTL